MIKKLTIYLILLISLKLGVQGQQYPYFTHFSFNKFVNNPAAAGVDINTTVNLIAREQWIGQKGTPKTHALVFDSRILGDSYILKKLRIRKKMKTKSTSGSTGWGASIINDINGPISRTWLNTSYAYHIKLDKKQLSFGLSMLLFQNRLDGDKIIPGPGSEIFDPLLNEESFWILDANFGAFFSAERYYAGYSTIQLLNSGTTFGIDNSGLYKLKRQHNLMGGYKFYLFDHIDLEPSILLKIPETFHIQLDVSLKFVLDELYWAGVNYKTSSAVALFGGLKYDKYQFGYAFEYDFTSMAKQTFATHEIIIIAHFGDASRRFKWLNSY